jgi:hypothetical protein
MMVAFADMTIEQQRAKIKCDEKLARRAYKRYLWRTSRRSWMYFLVRRGMQ